MKLQLERAAALLYAKKPNPDKILQVLKPVLKSKKKVHWLAYHYMGLALLMKCEYENAVNFLREALNRGSDEPETHHSLSMAYMELGQYQKAEEHGKVALRKRPEFFKAWLNLGAIYRAQARLDEALKCYQKANQLDPRSAGVAFRIASIYRDQGNIDQALELFDIALKIDSEYFEAFAEKARVLQKIQRFDEARESLNVILERNPKNLDARVMMAEIYRAEGKYEEAISSYNDILLDHPKNGAVRVNYALTQQEIGSFNESEKNYLKAFEYQPDSVESFSNYLMGLHYNPERTKEEIFEAHLKWDEHFAPARRPNRPVPHDKNPARRLRIGFLSGGFWRHPVGWMITPGLENLPKEQYDIYCYTTNNLSDNLTRRIHAISDSWKSVVGYKDEIIAGMIRDDEIDILVELSGHSADNRLRTVVLEPAPIIVKWVGGLFNTSGLRAVDYLITDRYETPAGEEQFYTEKLVRMPDDYICFLPPDYAPEVKPLPYDRNGHITFGCFNNPTKVNSVLIEKWAGIMNRVPQSRLLLKSKQYSSEMFIRRIVGQMEELGISRDRLIFEGQSTHPELLDTYNQVDIALDPWPYSGGLSTCEALWMGTPVVTLPGPTFAGRHSATHLMNAGFSEWVVESWDAYIDKAVELATDTKTLAEIRSGLRVKISQSPLCDGQQFGKHLAAAFRTMWKQWVSGQEKGSGVVALSAVENKTLVKTANGNGSAPDILQDKLVEWRDHIDVMDSALPSMSQVNSVIHTSSSQHVNDEEISTNGQTNHSKVQKAECENSNGPDSGMHPGNKADGNDKPENEGRPKPWKIATNDEVVICTPADLNMLTPYVLLEQEQWYEPELEFIRNYIEPGMNILDIGAAFGVYALPMAKRAGPEGNVYAFEPGSIARLHLEMSKLENRLDNLNVISRAVGDRSGKAKWETAETPELNRLDNNGSDEVSLVTLDAWWEFEDRPEINLIKLDVNGNELDVLQGSAKLLKECSPVILLASDGGAHSDSKVAGLLDHFGYHLLEYVPGPQLLTDYDMEGDRDPYLLNLVAVKEDRLKDFKQQGWIHNEAFEPKEPEDGFWKSALGELPWAKSMISNWEEQSKLPQNREYVRGLDYLCAAEVITPKGTSNPTLRSEKAVLLLGAAQILIRLYNDGTQSPSIAMTLVRVLNALGKRGQAVEVLQKLIEHTKPGELNMMSELPFMLPMPELDHLPVKTKLDNWMMTHVIESWLHMCNHSSFMNGEKERKLLNAVGGNVENSAITEKKYLLSKVRTNPEHEHAIRQLPEGILPIRNRWFWHLISENNTSPASRSKAIDIIDIKEIRNYSYSGKDSVAIVMPCIDKEKGLITAQSLYRRAGMPCKIIIVYDSERCGFIKTLNDTCRQLDVRYVVYLAQDAFAGRNWLQQAYNTLEKTGKGLLAFNDGKWQGIIASFGMVRLSWVKSLYGDSVLFQGYKSHCADDELTAIARAADQHVYNPHISLIEVDHEKGMAGGGNISDRQLFFDRYAGGFDGLVPVDKLRQIAGDYHIKDVNNKAEHSKFEREGRIGDGDKHELLSLTHRTLSPKMYLEIGVQTGKSLALAQCESIGVDPEPILTVPLPKGAKVIPVTSDDFFQDKVPMPRSPDLIFIDGMHLVEYALRDFINTEKIASAGSVVVIDDIMPAHPAQAERKRSTSAWAGDVWKLWKILEEYRPDLYFLPVNASPTGLLFIAGLDPDSRVLENKYNEILSKYKRDLIPPRDILERNDVVSSGDDFITDFLAAMKKVRNRNAGKKEVAKVLKQKFGNKCTCRNNDRVLDLDRDKVVVYTAITAGYDTLQDPEYVAPGVDYVCFTDDPGLKSDVWQVIPLDDDEADAVRVAKMPKILPHKFLPGHSISIWVDGNIKHIGDVRTLIESNLNNTNMALFKHPENRTSLKEEVEICIQMRKDDPGLLANQMHVYKQLGLPADVRVPTCMIMLRRHHCADVRLTMDKWWNEIKKRSRRDQVSFPYVSWVNSLKYNLIDNNSRDNEVFQWQPHRNIVAGQHTTPNNRRVTMSEKSQENGHYSSAYFQQRKELAKTSAKKILEIIYSKIAPESVIDFGCATGTWLAEFRGLGVRDLCGIDGPWVNKDLLEIKREDFLVHDFNKKNYKPKQKYDLALCIEVAEHISKDMGEKLVASLTEASDRVLFSAAVKAQGGTGHINEQPQHYWADRFLSHGYVAVDMIRPLIWNDDSVNVIYKQNMLLYVKKGLAGDPNLKEMIVSQKYDLDKIHPELFWMRSNRK